MFSYAGLYIILKRSYDYDDDDYDTAIGTTKVINMCSEYARPYSKNVSCSCGISQQVTIKFILGHFHGLLTVLMTW